MQIVIDIPETAYEGIKNACKAIGKWDDSLVGMLCMGVANGTPLPKGHGDLIERQVVIDKCNRLIEVEQKQGTDVMNYGQERVNSYEAILFEVESEYLVPTIIEADKEE